MSYSHEELLELYATYGRVLGSTSDKVLSQQPEVLLQDELLHLCFSKSFKEF